MKKSLLAALLALVSCNAMAQSDLVKQVNRYVDKYAKPFSLEGEPEQLCADEAAAYAADVAAKGKSREEAAAAVDRLKQSMERATPVERYQTIGPNAKQGRVPSSAFIVCYYKVKILKNQPIAGADRDWLPAAVGNKNPWLAADGQFYRTGASSWQYVSQLDYNKGVSDHALADMQRQVRAKTGREYPVKEATAACERELEAGDRATLRLEEERRAALEARVRAAAGKADELRQAERELRATENYINSLRTGRYSSRSMFSPSGIAWVGILPDAEVRSFVQRWEREMQDPSEDKRTVAAASHCLYKFRLAHFPAKGQK